MNAIVVVDQNWAIGRDNDLLFSLPTDMKRFRSLTLGGTVILGRRTLDSFPGGRPLPKRRNIVITHCPDFSREGAETVSRLMTANPARLMGWAGKGELDVGKDADLVLLDCDYQVARTVVGGRTVYTR